MADAIAIDVAYTSRQFDAMFAAYPELLEDDDLRADMLEAETDLNGLMSRLVRLRQERVAHSKGLADYIESLTERKKRKLLAANAIEDLMRSLMTAARLPKLVLGEATISVTKGRQSVSIIDIDALPQGFFATERHADKKAIADAIAAGEDVPGAATVVGETSLTIRTR